MILWNEQERPCRGKIKQMHRFRDVCPEAMFAESRKTKNPEDKKVLDKQITPCYNTQALKECA